MFDFLNYKSDKAKVGRSFSGKLEDYISSARSQVLAEQEERRKEIAYVELSLHIGKPVICISNEIANPKVGIAKEIVTVTQANVPMLLVEDVVTGESVMPFGVIMAYTEQKFDALNAMDPQARVALLYYRNSNHVVNNEPESDMVSPEEWASLVKGALQNLELKKRKP